jgi:hypothetical protein
MKRRYDRGRVEVFGHVVRGSRGSIRQRVREVCDDNPALCALAVWQSLRDCPGCPETTRRPRSGHHGKTGIPDTKPLEWLNGEIKRRTAAHRRQTGIPYRDRAKRAKRQLLARMSHTDE